MKKISPVVVVGLVLTAASFVVYVAGPAFIGDISHKAYDAFLRQVHSDPKSGKVVIADLDEKSLEEVGQWPWPRYVLAELTEKLLDAGASVVAFDIVFPEKDRTSPAVIRSNMKERLGVEVKFENIPPELRDFDLLFAKVLRRGRTILGCFMKPSDELVENRETDVDRYFRSYVQLRGTGGNVYDCLMQAGGLTISIPELSAAANTAFYNATPDRDGIVRANPLIWALGTERTYSALALEAVRMDRGTDKCVVRYHENGVESITLPPGERAESELVIPVDQAGRLKINYRKVKRSVETGFVSSFPVYSAAEILGGEVGREQLENKIVFVGTSAVGLMDIKTTPLTQFFSGVEVHATMADNMLAGDMLRDPTWMVAIHAVSIVGIGVFLTFFISRGRSWLSFLVSIALILAVIKISLVLLERYQVVFVPVWMILAVIIIYPVLTMIKFWQEEMEKKQVRSMFGTMVSGEVLEYLEANPGSFSLTGQKAEATMFFSDVAGFTSISESLRPDELSNLLNRYLSPMTRIIMERQGLVDKYEGDLIMAEWGVPFPLEDHAVQACLAALEQQEELNELRPWLKKAFGKEITVRMGLNSGTVTAGNMGSDRRFEFTVMGDAVNLAARLEPANRDYGTGIIVGEMTHRLASDSIETRLLDKLVVQGKTVPVKIYELLGRKGAVSESRLKKASLYEDALKMHWERRWENACSTLDKALKLDPRDTAGLRLRMIIQGYAEDPPPEGWQGEFIRASKS
ncbi:MAG: CHASE2 domain-containing protein [Kiritimatiellia bacterium]